VRKVLRTSAVLVPLGALLLALAVTGWGGSDSDRTLLFGFSGAVFLAVAALLLFTLRRGGSLAITDEGIVDNVSKARRGFVSWQDIASVSTKQLPFGQKALAFGVREGTPPARREGATAATASTDVSVALSLLDLSEQQLLDAIESKREQFRARHADG
jgi:hypothetical protein